MTKRRMRFAGWILKSTNTHSVYVILISFPLQQWLHERVLMLRYAYVARLATFSLSLFRVVALYYGMPYIHD